MPPTEKFLVPANSAVALRKPTSPYIINLPLPPPLPAVPPEPDDRINSKPKPDLNNYNCRYRHPINKYSIRYLFSLQDKKQFRFQAQLKKTHTP